MTELPFTTFNGTLKQMQPSELDENEAYALDYLFPLFRTLGEKFTWDAWAPVHTGMNGKVFYVGRGRERRYAGDKTLDRGRYFAVCNDSSGDDHETLLNELKAYYGYKSRIACQVFDSTVGNAAEKELERYGHKSTSWPHILLRIGPKIPNPIVERLGLGKAPSIHFPIPIAVFSCEIEKVIDLREPATQQWFFETFRVLEEECRTEVERETGIAYSDDVGKLQSFFDMLPILLSPELGGGHPFVQGTGAWLRSNGARAIIYPSARMNCSTSLIDGKLRDWRGWHLLLFGDGPPTDWKVHFGRTVSWKPFLGDAFNMDLFGESGESGFRCNGLSERNESRFQRALHLATEDQELTLFDISSGCFSPLEIDFEAKADQETPCPDSTPGTVSESNDTIENLEEALRSGLRSGALTLDSRIEQLPSEIAAKRSFDRSVPPSDDISVGCLLAFMTMIPNDSAFSDSIVWTGSWFLHQWGLWDAEIYIHCPVCGHKAMWPYLRGAIPAKCPRCTFSNGKPEESESIQTRIREQHDQYLKGI